MLTVSHLTKRYGKTDACSDVSFTLDEGNIHALLGPNGAGKSTLIKSVIGFLRYRGEVTVNGLSNRSPESKRILGYIPELPALYPNLTVGEHMEFIARVYGLTAYKDYEKELLERFELSDKVKKFGDELSKGMQQKLNICLGLLPRPSVLLLDEPMVGLDPHAIKELKTMMTEWRADGKTVLVSTHILDSVEELWDRALIMQNGQIKADVYRKNLNDQGKSLEDLFFAVTENASGEPR